MFKSKIETLKDIISTKYPVTIEIDEEGNPFISYQNDLFTVEEHGYAYKIVHCSGNRDEPEHDDLEPLGVIGNDLTSISGAFIDLIRDYLADLKAESEFDIACSKEIQDNRREEQELLADIEWERDWAGREEEFYRASEEAYRRGW